MYLVCFSVVAISSMLAYIFVALCCFGAGQIGCRKF